MLWMQIGPAKCGIHPCGAGALGILPGASVYAVGTPSAAMGRQVTGWSDRVGTRQRTADVFDRSN